VSVGLRVREVVDGDHVNVVSVALEDGAEGEAADAAEAVDSYAYRHV
jgi:hypothetical protein